MLRNKKLAEIFPYWSFSLGRTYALAGMTDEAELILEELEQTPVIPFTAIGRAIMNASMDRIDEAFKWLNYEPHHAWAAWSAVMPEFQALREGPRYEDFLERLNLPD